GTGRSWTSEALAAVKTQGVSSTLTDPWFLGSDVRADLTGFARRREEPSFTRRDAGGTFFEEEDLRDDYNFASVKAQAAYDTRDDIFFPTRGQRIFGAVERADTRLGGDVTFLRLTGGTRLFLPATRSTVLGLHSRCRWPNGSSTAARPPCAASRRPSWGRATARAILPAGWPTTS
ncbi:MAG: outer membrane protein assembly factor, partial [Desulfobacterales bacterium]|nr:outer membrane protein assembly factor [Desulfobacterales bacterium]